MTRSDALRAIISEAASARSALCETELVIRLDNILAIARAALEVRDGDEMSQSSWNEADCRPEGRGGSQSHTRA
ncbi:hypothetical protein [Azospirillum sp. B506]|uniref:hypothetical protein n=1 Tax=Azospirillum sp. B506 TaxID=137721 RepID=UPI0011DD572C|nr:hypothetical protein [Azospirillum sp. B506]